MTCGWVRGSGRRRRGGRCLRCRGRPPARSRALKSSTVRAASYLRGRSDGPRADWTPAQRPEQRGDGEGGGGDGEVGVTRDRVRSTRVAERRGRGRREDQRGDRAVGEGGLISRRCRRAGSAGPPHPTAEGGERPASATPKSPFSDAGVGPGVRDHDHQQARRRSREPLHLLALRTSGTVEADHASETRTADQPEDEPRRPDDLERTEQRLQHSGLEGVDSQPWPSLRRSWSSPARPWKTSRAAMPTPVTSAGQCHILDAGRPSGNEQDSRGNVDKAATKYQLVSRGLVGQRRARRALGVPLRRAAHRQEEPDAPEQPADRVARLPARISADRRVGTVRPARSREGRGSSSPSGASAAGPRHDPDDDTDHADPSARGQPRPRAAGYGHRELLAQPQVCGGRLQRVAVRR